MMPGGIEDFYRKITTDVGDIKRKLSVIETLEYTQGGGTTDHGSLSGLDDDDHTQYALLAGRAGGQTLRGGTGGSESLTLRGSAHATSGDILLNPDGGNIGIGTTSPASMLSVGATSQFQVNSTGNIVRLNDVATSFPSLQGTAGSILTNDGTGTLTWGSPSGSGALGYWQRNGTNLAPANIGDNVGIGTTTPDAQLQINTSSASKVAQIVRGAASQTANLTEWQNSAGSTLASIGADGKRLRLDNNTQAVYIPGGDFAGTMVIGDGGQNLSHVGGSDGRFNTFVGLSVGTSNTTGLNNSAVGLSAFLSNTTGTSNSALGVNALRDNTTGFDNSALGTNALRNNTTGTGNSAVGYQALRENTTGVSNSALGRDAGRLIADGSTANETGNTSLFLGRDTKALAAGQSNQIVIGYNATGLGSNTVVLGNDSIVTTALKGNVGIGTVSPDRKLDVLGQARVVANIAGDAAAQLQNLNSSGWGLTVDVAGTESSRAIFQARSDGGSQNVLWVGKNGNVGIGPDDPLRRFHVQDGSPGSISPSGSASVVIERDATNWLHMFSPAANSVGILFGSQSAAIRGVLAITPDNEMQLRTGGNNTRVHIAANGNVGIGTTAPQARLHAALEAGGGFATKSVSGVAGTAVALLPAGSVTAGVTVTFLVVASNGLTTGGTAWRPVNTETAIFDAGGVDVLMLRVTASGAVDVRRTAGSMTYAVAVSIVWI